MTKYLEEKRRFLSVERKKRLLLRHFLSRVTKRLSAKRLFLLLLPLLPSAERKYLAPLRRGLT
jgi:hypothetical protein